MPLVYDLHIVPVETKFEHRNTIIRYKLSGHRTNYAVPVPFFRFTKHRVLYGLNNSQAVISSLCLYRYDVLGASAVDTDI